MIPGRVIQDPAAVRIGRRLPEFHAIREFPRRHIAQFEALFVEVLQGELLAVDGTKIKANPSPQGAEPRPHADQNGSSAIGDQPLAGSGIDRRPGGECLAKRHDESGSLKKVAQPTHIAEIA